MIGTEGATAETGFAQRPGGARAYMDQLYRLSDSVSSGRPGIRLRGDQALRTMLAAGGPIDRAAAWARGVPCFPVRTILFDKSADNNWSLGWHQDRTIHVDARMDVPGFSIWSAKQGMIHVEPPIAILEDMTTLRVHLDDVPADNAPLLVAPGSHRYGRIAEADIAAAVTRCGTHACLAMAGDIWAYSTPILHASNASRGGGRRRVLQIDYATRPLPGGLRWAGL